MRLLVLNGPNLNLLGTRETSVYGSASLDELETHLAQRHPDVEFSFAQSNVEGDLIDFLQQADVDGVVFNPAGYSHTSVALRDAISAVSTPVVEVHISNIYAREDFRHYSLTGAVAAGVISGFGLRGYDLAVQFLKDR